MLLNSKLARLLPLAHAVVVVAVLLMCGGCSSPSSAGAKAEEQRIAREREQSARLFKGSIARGQQRVSIQELDQLTYGYADRYYMVISSAVDALKRGNADPAQRRLAHQIKLDGVLAMNDIVSGNDPYAQTLDLVVSVTLESIVWIDENRAEEVFGERADVLIKAMRTMRVEAWELAAKVLKQDQLERLDYIILEWRRAHPEIDQVAYVKFEDFAGSRAAGLLAEFKSGSGFLAPLSEASQVLQDWGRLTERVFWFSKRAPNIAAIQAEGAVNEILSTPEIGAVLETAQAIPNTIDAQRKALFAEIDARQTLLTNTLGDVRQIVADANRLGGTASILATNIQQTLVVLGDTIKVADHVGHNLGLDRPPPNPPPPPGRPFDILEYTIALQHANEVVTNLNALSVNADQLTRSAGWQKALQDMTDATDRRVDRVFTRICVALGLAFVLAVAYRFISLKMTRSMASPTRAQI
jgi:hypothetical protein